MPRKWFSPRLFLGCFLLSVVTLGLAANAVGADNAGPEASPAQGESVLVWVARCSGLIGAFILCLSFYFVATVTRLFIELRQKEAAPPELIEKIDLLIQQRDLRGAYKAAKDSETFLGRALSAGISELSHGLAEARDGMERASDALTIELEKKISILAVLGTLGPMIGLLGTLKGMISSFSVIARADVQLKASEVAGGISEALLLTFEGVALSVPAIYFFSVFRNRVATISANTTLLADQMLRKMYHAARGAKGPPSTPPPATPAFS